MDLVYPCLGVNDSRNRFDSEELVDCVFTKLRTQKLQEDICLHSRTAQKLEAPKAPQNF